MHVNSPAPIKATLMSNAPVEQTQSDFQKIGKRILVNAAIAATAVVVVSLAGGILATLKGVRHSDWLYHNGGTGDCLHTYFVDYNEWIDKTFMGGAQALARAAKIAQCEAGFNRILPLWENIFNVFASIADSTLSGYRSIGVITGIVVPAVVMK